MKKILLFVFLSLLIIIPAGKVGAAQYFVGVTVASAQAPGVPAANINTNWCLPQGTTVTIRNSSGTPLTPIAPTSQYTEITRPACAGSTIWSGLFNLTTATQYQAYIEPGKNAYGSYGYYKAYCSGAMDGRYSGGCFETWPTTGQNKNCTEICAYYNSTPTGNEMHDQSCSYVEPFLMGATCSSCTANAVYNYFEPSTLACWYSTANGASAAARLGTGLERVCLCNAGGSIWLNFTFPFTTSF